MQELKEKFKIVEKEDDKMALDCHTGGYKIILRNAGTYDGGGDDTVPVDNSGGAAPVQADKGGGMARAVDGEGDVCVQVPDQDGRGDDAVPDQAKYIDGGGAVPLLVPVDMTDDMAEKVIDDGDAIQVPVDEGGGAVTQAVEDDCAVCVQVPVDEGGGDVLDPVDEEGDATPKSLLTREVVLSQSKLMW